MTRVLVTGDRYWDDPELVDRELSALHAETPITVLIEGCATGADDDAYRWARYGAGVTVAHHAAHWRHQLADGLTPTGHPIPACPPSCRLVVGRAAGPIRNGVMLATRKPEYAIAFHDDLEHSHGTADMVRRLVRAGIPVRHVAHGREPVML